VSLSAWDKDANDSHAVQYWKHQVRRWQVIVPLVLLAALGIGMALGAIITIWAITA